MRIVLDTNVLISAILFGGVPEQVVIKILGGPHNLVISPYVIEETNRILETKFAVSPDTLELVNQVFAHAEVKYFQPFLHIVKDEPDNRIIETAVKGRADAIVTGDKLLLSLGQYQAIHVITPGKLLEALA
jgi:putative PIN family toxin of toxin-antitoxin system